MRTILLGLVLLAGCKSEPCDDCVDAAQMPDASDSDAITSDASGRDANPPMDAVSRDRESTDAGSADAESDDVSFNDDAAPDDAYFDSGPLAFTIATWNIENFPAATSTPALVQQVIETHRWDLIAIQEIDNDDAFLALRDALADYDGFVSFDSRAFQRNAILFRTDRVRVDNVRRLFERDGYAFPRDPLAGDVSFLDPDGAVAFDFAFVVVHLKATLEEESRLRRLDAIEKLDAWTRGVIAGGEEDVIIAGDFNDDPNDEPAENVFGPLLGAGYRVLTTDVEEDAFSFIPFRALIDHVVITSGASPDYGMGSIDIADVRNEVLNYENNVSDHLPVVARFVP